MSALCGTVIFLSRFFVHTPCEKQSADVNGNYFWSQLCFVAPPKLLAITVDDADVMKMTRTKCHAQFHCRTNVSRSRRERTNRCRINGWNPRKYDRNDYLFKLNRSTKSSSVLVNCLHNLRYFISLMAIECARTSCNVSYRICVRARARAWTGIFVFLIWSIVHNL